MKNVNSKTSLIISTVILAGLSGVQTAWAEQVGASFSEEILVSDGELASQRGQGGGVSINMASNSQVAGNVINVGPGGSVVNGNNILGDHAFENANGIATVIQNSGNNVAIQNNTLVNVSIQ